MGPCHFIMAKLNKKPEGCQSFVYRPSAPSCVKEDGGCDYAKLNALLAAAKGGDENAKMLVFEQYQGLWRKIISEFLSKFEEYGMDYEDLQQEAFLWFLVSLKKYKPTNQKSFSDYYGCTFRSNLVERIRKEDKLVNAQYCLCSLDARDAEGKPLYEISAAEEDVYFADYYPNIRPLLSESEFKIAVAHFVDDLPLRVIAKQLGISYGYVRNIVIGIKGKLQRKNFSKNM